MGRSVTSKYRLEIVDHGGYKWQIAFLHKPTVKNLETFINAYNKSVLEGCNSHLDKNSLVHTAKIVCQTGDSAGQVVLQINAVNVL